MRFKTWLMNEEIEQQRQRIDKLLKSKFPNKDQTFIDALFAILQQGEGLITDPEDRRRTFTISKFMNQLADVPGESPNHTLDKIKNSLNQFVNNRNLSLGNKEENTLKYIQSKLPGETPEIINTILQKVVKSNQPVDQAISQYLSTKSDNNSSRTILKEDPYEIIEITGWNPNDKKDKHLDTGEQEFCHILLAGTKWCVRFKNYFSEYTGSGPLYLIRKNGKPYLLGHKNSDWLDVNDKQPSDEVLKEIFPLIKKIKVPGLFGKNLNKLITLNDIIEMQDPELAYNYKGYDYPQELIDIIAKDPRFAYLYAFNRIKQRFPKGEAIIATNPKWSVAYALNILKDRFPKAESTIAKDPRYAEEYAEKIIGGRFPEGEEAIKKDPESSFKYCVHVLDGEFPKEFLSAIAKDPMQAYKYADRMYQGGEGVRGEHNRFLEGEPAIATDPIWSYEYAKNILGGRFLAGEKAIATDPEQAFNYAKNVIKGKFPEGESAIAQKPLYAFYYALDVLDGPFPEGEKAIMSSSSYARQYKALIAHNKEKEEKIEIPPKKDEDKLFGDEEDDLFGDNY